MCGLFQMKLQYRLLTGFLLCALIAGISGGCGYSGDGAHSRSDAVGH